MQLPGLKCTMRISKPEDVHIVDETVFVRLCPTNWTFKSIVLEKNALAPSPTPSDFAMGKCCLGLMQLTELRNTEQAKSLIDDVQRCRLWDPDDDQDQESLK